MVISFDYDNTITAAKHKMLMLMALCNEFGWDVYVCSGRLHTDGEELDWLKELDFVQGVYTTDYQNKRQFMEEKGIHVDVWVDDVPESILCDLDKESLELSLPNLKEPLL